MIVWFPKRFPSSLYVKSLFHTLNLDPKMADKNLHWMFWTLPISVNWIFNGREKDSDQHEKYLYRLLTHVKEGPKRDICNVYPAWCCNVCASGTETFHLLFLLAQMPCCWGPSDQIPHYHIILLLKKHLVILKVSDEKWWSFGQLCMQWLTQKRQEGLGQRTAKGQLGHIVAGRL